MKKDPNNPDKQYTAADFPTIKIDKIIQYSWSTSPLGQDTQDITIVFPIYNRRNVINVLEKVKKMDGVLLAEPSYAMAPF